MKIVKEILSWTANILIAFVIAIFINVFLFQQTYVDGRSMEPTLQDNDRVFVSKILHTFKEEPDYGDIVIIDSRLDNSRTLMNDIAESVTNNLITNILLGKERADYYWIKRVIGKSGDVLEFRDGKIIRNGEELEEFYTKEKAYYPNMKKVVVPENHVFVMGDNRNYSKDSRKIGSVPLNHVIGKYIFKY